MQFSFWLPCLCAQCKGYKSFFRDPGAITARHCIRWAPSHFCLIFPNTHLLSIDITATVSAGYCAYQKSLEKVVLSLRQAF